MKVAIIGGGIGGLSAAWSVQKKYPDAEIVLFEKADRLGGWIRTRWDEGFLFEQGPRTFQVGKCPHLMKLILELGLKIVEAPPQKRYLYVGGKMRSMGSFLFRMLPALALEPFVRSKCQGDESIQSFATRRFGKWMAETLFEPMTLGIYGGDFRKLSIRACFPTLYELEKKGSVLKGFFGASKPLFTIEGGMEKLIDALKEKIRMEVHLNTEPEEIDADLVIKALPPPFPKQSLWVVNVGFRKDLLTKKGFGYLVPTKEKEMVMGAIFDSCIFPLKADETRITFMLRAEAQDPKEVVLDALKRHLHISDAPDFLSCFFALNAIAQFPVGCNYSGGVSVEAAIQKNLMN